MDANTAQSGAATETHPDVGLELAAKAMLIGKYYTSVSRLCMKGTDRAEWRCSHQRGRGFTAVLILLLFAGHACMYGMHAWHCRQPHVRPVPYSLPTGMCVW
jgi:hypothetical protein